ncbi:MAG: hypothetical protein LBD68_10025, partial [Zoogloeaceae bacterium]|nr:hypothetical protein [Zoogloeaceae bacterium]
MLLPVVTATCPVSLSPSGMRASCVFTMVLETIQLAQRAVSFLRIPQKIQRGGFGIFDGDFDGAFGGF